MPAGQFLKKKNFFGTYQHVELAFPALNAQEILDKFVDFFTATLQPSPLWVTACIEQYPTEEGYHVHCLLEYDTSTSVSREAIKLEGIFPFLKNCSHGRANIKRVRDYCLKSEPNFTNYVDASVTNDSEWGSILECATRLEAEKAIQSSFPKYYICNYSNIRNFLDGYFRGSNAAYVPDPSNSESMVPYGEGGEAINLWIAEEFPKVIIFIFFTRPLDPPRLRHISCGLRQRAYRNRRTV